MKKRNNSNKEKVWEYYQKITFDIATRIFDTCIEQGSDNAPNMSTLTEFASSTMNEFSSVFIKLLNDETDEQLSTNFKEQTQNVWRRRLLDFGLEMDFIPDESLVGFCCGETATLIYYTDRLRNE